MRHTLLLTSLAITLALGACAHPPAGTLRFKPEPPVWQVNDRTPLAKQPAERIYNRTLYQLDGFFVRRLTRAMDVVPQTRAADVNSVDEVPDSTWFTNRIGVRELSLDEVRRGPNLDPNPLDHLPLTIQSGKIGGTSLGFIVEDATHTKYLLKFDNINVPEMETAAHIIGHRILWACGYNVPEDYLGYLKREDLVVSPKASIKDVFGHKSPLSVEQVEHALKQVYRTDDGRFRVLVSRFLPGKPIGPFAREGTRPDDPNDKIPHERRRSVRGEAAIFSWINHTDIQEDNSLDTWVTEPGSKDRGHVVHYLIDFGKAFGVMNNSNHWKTVGYTYRLDVKYGFMSLISFGLWDRPWETLSSPPLRGIGLWTAENFDPGTWRINSPYWPFDDKDRFDSYWGAKIVARFTPEQLAAIVEEAKFTDPRSAQYMLDTLLARQRIVTRYWFARVSPLDHFQVERPAPGRVRLCFDDLALTHHLERGTGHYRVELFDAAGHGIGGPWRLDSADGHACVVDVTLGATPDAYTIVRLAAYRNGRLLPAVKVHLARTASGQVELIGLRRD